MLSFIRKACDLRPKRAAMNVFANHCLNCVNLSLDSHNCWANRRHNCLQNRKPGEQSQNFFRRFTPSLSHFVCSPNRIYVFLLLSLWINRRLVDYKTHINNDFISDPIVKATIEWVNRHLMTFCSSLFGHNFQFISGFFRLR